MTMTMTTMLRYCCFLLILLVFDVVASATPTPTTTDLQATPPTFHKWELREPAQRQKQIDDALRNVLSTTGLFAVDLSQSDDSSKQADNDDDDDVRRIALNGLCECYDNPKLFELDNNNNPKGQQQHNIHTMLLQDSQTHRTSIGTATIGTKTPLELPSGLEKICTPQVVDAMEELREQINDVTASVLMMLDRLFVDDDLPLNHHHQNKQPLLRDSYNKQYFTFTDIVESSTNLEHFHVYHQNQNNQKQDVGGGGEEDQQEIDPISVPSEAASATAAWDWHTDAGLFLVFVPAWDCSNSNILHGGEEISDTAFWYKDSEGKPIQAKFQPNTAIVMMGQGIQDWLNLHQQHSQIRATVHSVRLPSNQSRNGRAWYGTMQLVPENALISNGPKQTTLSQIKSSLVLNNNNNEDEEDYDDVMISLGCGSISESMDNGHNEGRGQEAVIGTTSQRHRRRRLQHQDPSGCNNVTNFFCWMQCLDIPNSKQIQGYVNEGYSLYCLDPAILASSGGIVSQAAEPCQNGWIHDPACEGMWQITAPGVPAATINVTADPTDVEQPFCYGGTTMYMDGFYFIQGTTCVIYLFQSWVLNSSGKFVIAFFGTILGGIFLEKIIQQRRRVMSSMSDAKRYHRLAASAIFYGTQLSLGYMLMLVIMIYSGILFIATILGLVAGHVMFNAKDAIWPLKDNADDEDEQPGNDDDDDDDDENNNGQLEFEELHHGIDMEGGQIQHHASSSCCVRGGAAASAVKGGLHPSSCCGSKMDITDPTGELTTELTQNNTTYGSTATIPFSAAAAEAETVSTTSGSNTSNTNSKNSATAQKKSAVNKKNNNHGVAEGATPCCQHSL